MKTLSVVIGRFQVPILHSGHVHLINQALERSDTLLILIGTTEALPSIRNPLTYQVRERMMQEAFPSANVLPLPDHPSDAEWSISIDRIVAENFPKHTAALFGSRNSFIPCYSGDLPIVMVKEIAAPSGTDTRENIVSNPEHDPQFRAGMIYAQSARLPISYQTVDIAVLKHPDQTVLMGRKKTDGENYRFIGGFVDPKDGSLEEAAYRELREEAGPIDCHGFKYLGSFRISDNRYRDETDKVMTAFFFTYKLAGREMAGDDIDELAWIPIKECEQLAISEHKPLAARLLAEVNEK